MKKNIMPILSSLIMAVSLNSCNLDRFPDDKIATETYWNTEKDATLALNGVYSFLGGAASSAWYSDAYTDNTYAQYPWETSATVGAAGDITANTDFGYDWVTIRRANTLLENIGKVKMDESRKNRFIAEARFLRAFNYFNLTQLFGAVPLFQEAVPTGDKLTPVPEKDVVTFILKELTDAANVLPVSYGGGSGDEKGRVTKGAALALKARVQLYSGLWNDAAVTAKQVIDSGTYNLFKVTNVSAEDMADNYGKDFVDFSSADDQTNFYKGLKSYEKLFWAENETNSEFILTRQFIENSQWDQASSIYTLLMPNELSGWSSITPTIEFVNAYLNRDGSVFTPPSLQERAANYNNGAVKPDYIKEFKNRDTRLYASIIFPTSRWNQIEKGFTFNWNKGGNNTSRTGYNFRKLVDPKYKQEANAPQDYPIIRYAEILLTYAEAKNEQAGPDASIYDALDLIRDRVSMPKIQRNQTKESLRNIIRNERRVELAQEGFRYSDIRRWGIAKDVMKDTYDITNGLVQKRVWNDRYNRFPYPQSAVDYNPLLKQAQSEKGY
ncbi:RagB/SusD family nutrient uptake outer membrane protein [Elizabethkingia miricola]|nr:MULTISPECIES: RagB/SusD family nutrient uptake outer membrane protein [Elizabethkingia]